MTDNELKRMSRANLIDIISQYQSREQKLTQEIKRLTSLLDDRKTHIENSGSIAEAALALNHIFEAAQTAADQYVEEVREANASKEIQAKKIVDEAMQKAELIQVQAQNEYNAILGKAKQECDAMYGKITELLKNYEELRSLLSDR